MRMLQTPTLLVLAIVAVAAACWLLVAGAGAEDWRTASREPAGLAPPPATTPEAVLQVYAARAWGWRGYFGVHTWIAVKPAGAPAYTVYEVVGWRLRWNDSSVAIQERAPDARWFGSVPDLLAERRGPAVEALIARIDQAARAYPYPASYSVWPGPNSNTFTAHVARAVPELEIHLPPTAIGKDYLGDRYVATAPSGSGFQLSFYGLAGVLASAVEGIEVNLLGLSFGVDPLAPAVKLPLIGRIGLPPRNGSPE
jgi:hypothetical protein